MQNFMGYKDIFDLRSVEYINAMITYPQIRYNEFKKFIQELDLRANEKFLDIPCGTGLCKSFTKPLVKYIGVDPCSSFILHCKAHEINAINDNLFVQSFNEN